LVDLKFIDDFIQEHGEFRRLPPTPRVLWENYDERKVLSFSDQLRRAKGFHTFQIVASFPVAM